MRLFLVDTDAQWNSGGAGDQDGTEDSIVFDGATIVTPTGKLLARQLSLVIGPQHSILITGPNGSGAHLLAAQSHVAAMQSCSALTARRCNQPGAIAFVCRQVQYLPGAAPALATAGRPYRPPHSHRRSSG